MVVPGQEQIQFKHQKVQKVCIKIHLLFGPFAQQCYLFFQNHP